MIFRDLNDLNGSSRLLSQGSEEGSLAARGSVAKTPYFLEVISCLAVIMGEMGGSGRNPGFDGRGKRREFYNDLRTIRGARWGRGPRSWIRADNGRFALGYGLHWLPLEC